MDNVENIIVKDENGIDVCVSYIGMFRVPDLDKQFIIYSLYKDDNDSIMLGEVVDDDGDMRIYGILDDERDIVVAYYKEIASQLGE